MLKLNAKTVQLSLLAILTLLCSTVSAATVPDLNFSASPVLVGGPELQVGAVYRFHDVAEGTHADVEVLTLENTRLISIDDNSHQSLSFRPRLEPQGDNGYVIFALTLIDAASQSAQLINTRVSLAANRDIADEIVVHAVSDYTREFMTTLELSSDKSNALFIKPGISADHSGVVDSYSSVSASIVQLPRLLIEIRANASQSADVSVLFDEKRYSNAVFTNINDKPVAVDDHHVFDVNKTLVVPAYQGLLANDSDIDVGIDTDVLEISHFRINSVEHSTDTTASFKEGAVTINKDGAYRFVPAVNYRGAVSAIDYIVRDGSGGFDTAALALVSRNTGNGKRTVADATSIELLVPEDINTDGYINREELQGQLDVSVLLPDNAVTGSVVFVDSGTETQSAVIDENHLLEQRVKFAFTPPSDGQIVSFDARLESQEGVLLSAHTLSVQADLTIPERPLIRIVADTDDSGFLSAEEHNTNVVVVVTLPVGVAVNDTVYVDYGVGNESLVLTPLDVAEGMVSFTLPVAQEGQTLSVVASIVDEAENRSPSGSDSVLIDTIAPPVPTVAVLLSASATPLVAGTFPVDGDYILSVKLNEITYVTEDTALSVDEAGNWQLLVPVSDALPDGTYDVVALVADIAGNSSTDQTAAELSIDLIAPVISVDEIAPSSDAAPMISGVADEADSGVVQISTEQGEAVCLAVTNNEGQWSCHVRRQLLSGENKLIASASDIAGNTTNQPFTVSVVFTSDSDGDGIADDIEGTADTDGDNVADYLDLDSDNDGITDAVEGMIDTDLDGERDYIDSDSDGDGISDLIESTGAATAITITVVGSNGIADDLETTADSGEVEAPRDSDGDQHPDFRDLDSDNDGIPDRSENTAAAALNSAAAVDSDSDGLPDYIDLDADQDSIPDIVEQQMNDNHADGRVDLFTDLDLNGLHDDIDSAIQPLDLDGDGLWNFVDLDSDGDGRFDIAEYGGADSNRDGRHDDAIDLNANAINDAVDSRITGGTDADDDGIDDLYDADYTAGNDTDGDGISDVFDADADGDGLIDAIDIQSTGAESLRQVYEFQPTTGAVLSTGTGTLGGGCVLVSFPGTQSDRRVDPFLLILLLFAQCGLWRSCRRTACFTQG